MIIGIDLGTTYSVIAVYGDIKTEGNYPDSQYINECNVSLIPDPYGSFAIPSAFWSDPENPDNVVFGTDAKELAKDGMTPILFSKRSIGTTKVLTIGNKTYSAKDVATQFLKYLKGCAETALGKKIDRAVITHPAYFSLNQIEETREAAIVAGFDMSDGEQMMQEPQAAALSYIASDPRHKITALTYDLGGGTFDVTVVKKEDGVTTCIAFDGNPLLGGYNFDKKLVSWLLTRVRNRLKGTGRTFKLDENDTKDQSCMSNLLQCAEEIKYDLVRKPTSKAPVAISIKKVLYDTKGKTIDIIDRINREEYTALIQELLDDTIDRTNNAIRKSKLSVKDVDVIVMVGGSSYGQWVEETIKKAFPDTEILHHDSPDLCVAMGAAILAESLGIIDTGDNCNYNYDYAIELDINKVSALPTIKIFGSVKMKNGDFIDSDLREGFYLMLDPDDDAIGEVRLNDDCSFIFNGVELLEDEPTNLIVKLFDKRGILQGELPFSIEYTPDGSGKGINPSMQSVPKSLFIQTGSGLVTIAKEGDKLPVKSKEIRLVKIHDDSTIDLDIYQENDWVTTIKVENIPEDAGKGSNVILNVQITKKNIMRGQVVVKNQENKIVTEWPIDIAFPPIEIPSIEKLKDIFEDLENKRQEEIFNEKDPKRRTMLGGGDLIAKRIRDKFSEEGFIDSLEIHQAIKELEALFVIKKDEFDPPPEEFDKLLKVCDELVQLKSDSGERQSENIDIIEKIRRGRSEAQLQKNKKKWRYNFELLERLHSKIKGNVPPPPPPKLPPTEELKDYFHEEIIVDLNSKLTSEIRRNQAIDKYDEEIHEPRIKEVENEITDLSNEIQNIDNSLKPEDALNKLQRIMRKKKKVEVMIRDVFETLRIPDRC